MSTYFEIEGLSVAFGGVRAVNDVSLAVDEGQLVGLIGANGAGKTTMLDAVTGFVQATGSVRFLGREIVGLPAHKRSRLGIARTWQHVQLFDDLTIRENLLIAASGSRRTRDLMRFWSGADVDRDAVRRVLAEVGLEDVSEREPAELSHGRRKLVGVARALIADPRLLLLDEPAAGLDSSESAQFGEVLRDLRSQGHTTILVDHDMGLVLGVCDLVYVLDRGTVIAAGVPDDIRANEAVIAAYLGEAVT